jgi:hypothetical protein
VEKFGDSPAIKMARRTGRASVCLNLVDGEWVLTWTTGGKETIVVRDVEGLKVEPLYEEKLTYEGYGPRSRRCYKSEGATNLSPDTSPNFYDGLSFKGFSEIVLDLQNDADFYLDWECVASGKQFTYI